MDFQQMFSYFRARAGLDITETARQADVTYGYIRNIEKGMTRPPTPERCDQFAKIFKLSDEECRSFKDAAIRERNPEMKTLEEVLNSVTYPSYSGSQRSNHPDMTIIGDTIPVPLLGVVPADNIRLTFDHVEAWYDLPRAMVQDKESFILKIKGYCLEDERIHDGDFIVVSKNFDFVNNKIYVVRVDGEVTCKKVFREDSTIILQRANASMPDPIVINPKKQKFEIVGRVTASWRHM